MLDLDHNQSFQDQNADPIGELLIVETRSVVPAKLLPRPAVKTLRGELAGNLPRQPGELSEYSEIIWRERSRRL